MQACSQAGNKGGQASNGPLSQQKDGSLQSGAFSEAQPLMNGQGDSDRHAEHGAGGGPLQPSRHSSGGDIGVEDGGGGEMSMGDQELLGQQTLDFWLNLCIGHTLIVEQDENGGPSVFQVQHLLTAPLLSNCCTTYSIPYVLLGIIPSHHSKTLQ